MADTPTAPINPAQIAATAQLSYRDRARMHASAARATLHDDPLREDTELLDYLDAIANALVSIAYSQLAPPARRPQCSTPRTASR